MINNKVRIILLGPPGVGKGTISDLLIKNIGLEHISTGNLFRKAIKQNDERAKELQEILNSGRLVPDSYTNNIAKEAILNVVKNDKGFILDGYPRTIEQAKYLETILDIDYVFYLNLDSETLINRICGRRICLECNSIYNVSTFPKPKDDGICDNCGNVLFQRKDDEVTTASKRIQVYLEETKPLVDFYTQQGKLIEIDARGSSEEIFDEIVSKCQK